MNGRVALAFLLGAGVATLIALSLNRAPMSVERLRAQLIEKPELIADHPEILDKVRQVLANRELASLGAKRAELLRGKWSFLMHAGFTPTLGNANSSEVLLEFTDYTCLPCRATAPAVREAVAARSDVRVAILLLPIGGALSDYTARVALAAYRQNPQKFAELHHRLMEQRGAMTQQSIIEALKDSRFDVDQIERELQSAENRRYLKQVREFSEELGVSGVPAFAREDKLLLGGATLRQLEALVGSRTSQGSST